MNGLGHYGDTEADLVKASVRLWNGYILFILGPLGLNAINSFNYINVFTISVKQPVIRACSSPIN